MKKILSALGAGALAVVMAGTSLLPAQAAPAYMPNAPQTTTGSTDIVQVNGQDWRWRHGNRGFNGRYGGHRGGWNRDYYRGGHRGGWNRDYYRGHHRGNNLGGAVIGGLITGAIVGGVLNNSGPAYRERVYRGGNSHVQWCYDRYRTYRASDNTYVPRVGYRAYCNSPYN